MAIGKYARLMQASVLSGVLSVRRLSYDRVAERLSDLEFVTRVANLDPVSGQFEIQLQILDEELLYQLLSGEAHRFFLAAVLSHARSQQAEPRNFAWQAVEHYYSAYYSIHYLARISGHSLTSLGSDAVKAIKNNMFGGTLSQIPEGLYMIAYDRVNKILTLRKKKKSGGSHKDAWAMWESLLNNMISAAATDDVEYASESVSLQAHKKFILRSTGMFRPPELRGEINYQFVGGSWRFEKESEKSIRLLQTNLRLLDPTSLPLADIDISALLKNNYFIYSLAKNFFRSAAENYPRSITRKIFNEYAGELA